MTNFSALLFYSVSVCKYEKKIGELKNDKEDFVKGKGLLVLLLVFILILFSSGTGSEGIVKNALCKRTNAMNDFYLGKLTYQEACEKLSEIEQGRLLDDDRNSLKSFFGTDIEEVVGYDVRDIVIHYEDYEVICAFLSFEWKVNC